MRPLATRSIVSSEAGGQQLQEVYKKTSETLMTYARAQKSLLVKIQSQEQEIAALKERLSRYEPV